MRTMRTMRKIIGSCCLAWMLASAGWAVPSGKAFSTPEAAVQALAEALRQNDRSALGAIMGPDLPKLESADAAERAAAMQRLRALVKEGWSLSTNQGGDRVLRLGAEGWSFPVPLTKTGKGWQFDTEAGVEEVVNRRVGRNELAVIESCQLLSRAESIYHDANSRYTDRTASSPGQKDGLYWPVAEGGEPSPLAQTFGDEATYWSSHVKRTPWFGYYFSLRLTPQGYLVCAWPEKYGDTGVMSFCGDQSGKLYERDMGPGGGAQMRVMENLDEGAGWSLVIE